MPHHGRHPTLHPRRLRPYGGLAIWISLLVALPAPSLAAHKDVVTMKNGDTITGEIKRMQKGMLHFRPGYTKKVDVLIEWDQVARLDSDELFVFVTSSGARFTGSLHIDPDQPNVILISEKLRIHRHVLVEIQQLESSFWQRWKLDLYLGYTLTKANSQNQISFRTNARYRTDRAETRLGLNSLITIQNEGNESKRGEGTLSWRRELAGLWFATTALNLLRSDEQALDLRSTTSASGGRFIFRNVVASMSASLGLAWTYEDFMDPTPNQVNSAEGVIAIGGDVYGYRELNLAATLDVFPSLTESDRVRVNINLDVSWEIVGDLDFLINYFQNWDSASDTGSDYGIVSSIGWTL